MAYSLSRQIKAKIAGEIRTPVPPAAVRPAAVPDIKAPLNLMFEEMVDDPLFKALIGMVQKPHIAWTRLPGGGKYLVMDPKADSSHFTFYIDSGNVELGIKPDSVTSKTMGAEEFPRVKVGSASDPVGLKENIEIAIVDYALTKARADHKRLSRGRCSPRDRPYLEKICEVLDVAPPFFG